MPDGILRLMKTTHTRLNLVILLFAVTYGYNCLGAPARMSALATAAPLTFEINARWAGARSFQSVGPGYRLRLTPHAAQLRLRPSDGGSPIDVSLRWVNAATSVLVGEQTAPGEPRRHRQVRYTAVYPGIDAVFYGNPQRLEYDFIVSPGGRPDSIGLVFDGIDRVQLEEHTGDLLLRAGTRVIRQHAPVAYQEWASARHPVSARYVIRPQGVVAIALGEWRSDIELVIDPILEW